MVAKQIRGELLKIFSELGFLTLSSVLLLLKVSFLEIFLQWLYCALYVCMWGGAHVLRCTHINAYTHALCTQRTHIHMHPHMCTLGCVCTHIHTQMYTHVQVHHELLFMVTWWLYDYYLQLKNTGSVRVGTTSALVVTTSLSIIASTQKYQRLVNWILETVKWINVQPYSCWTVSSKGRNYMHFRPVAWFLTHGRPLISKARNK